MRTRWRPGTRIPRAVALDTLAAPGQGKVARALRINGIETRYGLADAAALIDSPADPDFVILPKTETAQDLRLLDRWLTLSRKRARIVALIESARGGAARSTRSWPRPRGSPPRCSGRPTIGAETAWEPLLGIRQRIVVAAALSGIATVDTPFFDIHDEDGLDLDLHRAIVLGFQAKAAIHPSQIALINAALTPSQDAVAHARKVMAVNAECVGTVDGQMIDEAVARKARRVLAAAGEAA